MPYTPTYSAKNIANIYHSVRAIEEYIADPYEVQIGGAPSLNAPELYVTKDWTATEFDGNGSTAYFYANSKGAWTSAHVLYNTLSQVQDDSTVSADKTVTGAVSNGSGLVRLTVASHGYSTGDRIIADSVGGVTAANGSWIVTRIDANTIDLQGSTFSGAYTSGGTTTNRPGYSAYLALVGPSIARGGLSGVNDHADDVNGFFVSNNGTAKATDAFYIGHTASIGGTEWDTVFSSDAITTNGILLNASGNNIVRGTSYGTSATPVVELRRGRGTVDAPRRAKSGDLLARFSGNGATAADDSTAATFPSAAARVDIYANEDFTASANGTNIRFYTTAVGGTSITERVRVAPADGFDFISGTFSSYLMRFKNNTAVVGRNNAGNADVNLLRINTSDQLEMMSDVKVTDAKNIVFDTTTGTKIGTGSTQKLGFYGATPVVRPSAYTASNVTTDRSYDANATTIDEVADVLGTLISDLQALGLIG